MEITFASATSPSLFGKKEALASRNLSCRAILACHASYPHTVFLPICLFASPPRGHARARTRKLPILTHFSNLDLEEGRPRPRPSPPACVVYVTIPLHCAYMSRGTLLAETIVRPLTQNIKMDLRRRGSGVLLLCRRSFHIFMRGVDPLSLIHRSFLLLLLR